MARSYANYGIPLPESSGYRHAHTWMTARLFELAWMSQGCVEAVAGGPEWLFHRDGAEVSTKPGVTLTLSDGSTAYWSALEPRHAGELPDWAKVQRFHAERLGASSWMLTADFIQQNRIEVANRTDAFYFLAHARSWNSADVERDILMAVHVSPQTLSQLAGQLKRPLGHVQAAALRLWRRRLVDLPMATQPLNDQWSVRGVPHGLG